MQKEYGDVVIEELERLDPQTRTFTKRDLIEMQEELKEKIKKMESGQ